MEWLGRPWRLPHIFASNRAVPRLKSHTPPGIAELRPVKSAPDSRNTQGCSGFLPHSLTCRSSHCHTGCTRCVAEVSSISAVGAVG